jgi:hypothetical protein
MSISCRSRRLSLASVGGDARSCLGPRKPIRTPQLPHRSRPGRQTNRGRLSPVRDRSSHQRDPKESGEHRSRRPGDVGRTAPWRRRAVDRRPRQVLASQASCQQCSLRAAHGPAVHSPPRPVMAATSARVARFQRARPCPEPAARFDRRAPGFPAGASQAVQVQHRSDRAFPRSEPRVAGAHETSPPATSKAAMLVRMGCPGPSPSRSSLARHICSIL